MARYRFTATDTEGREKGGTIEAASATEARERISSRGFHVKRVAIDSPDPEPLPLESLPLEPIARKPRASKGASGITHWLLHLVAVSTALAALGISLSRSEPAPIIVKADPPAPPPSVPKDPTPPAPVKADPPVPKKSELDKYDFSSPRAAVESDMKMLDNNDYPAAVELNSRVNLKYSKERISTLKVQKEVDFHGKKVLFISYKRDDVTRYDTRAVEKDAGTGFWVVVPLSYYTVLMEDKKLAAMMKMWDAVGSFE
ncbi:unnamed protein product [Gemmata massiliana]|uniref:Uncharacterized protein n=1 Tax=Gemmata massiliana TaxID=1210884 RepID=A0A6P2CYG1_9BACT|nr:hypothetical protein [Gemmata massiliana]VTR92834.1 unnamed protein product [Gemmata massiliana]